MKSMQKFVAALLGTALCAVLLATAAFAQGGVAVTLPVSIRTAGADPEPNAAYTLCLQAVDNRTAPRTASTALPCRAQGIIPSPAFCSPMMWTLCRTAATHWCCTAALTAARPG